MPRPPFPVFPPGAGSLRLALLALLWAPPVQAQSAALAGRVVDRATGAPVEGAVVVVEPPGISRVTDAEGAFRFTGLPGGTSSLSVEHLAYGEHRATVEIVVQGVTGVQVRLAPTAIELEPVEVEIVAGEAPEPRVRGGGRNTVTREEILAPGNTSANLGEILRRNVPSIRVRQRTDGICVEFRGVSSLQTVRGCRSLSVYVDGVPIAAPGDIFASIPPETVESMEVLSPAEAGARYGAQGAWGVLLIRTRSYARVLAPPLEEEGERLGDGWRHDWDLEPSEHGWPRVLASSLVANAAGLAVGSLAARHCIKRNARTGEGYVSNCGGLSTVAVAAAAVALPAGASALAARWAGRTDVSRGVLTTSLVGAALALGPGYLLILGGDGGEASAGVWAGRALVAVGAPALATLADHLFRRVVEGGR